MSLVSPSVAQLGISFSLTVSVEQARFSVSSQLVCMNDIRFATPDDLNCYPFLSDEPAIVDSMFSFLPIVLVFLCVRSLFTDVVHCDPSSLAMIKKTCYL